MSHPLISVLFYFGFVLPTQTTDRAYLSFCHLYYLCSRFWVYSVDSFRRFFTLLLLGEIKPLNALCLLGSIFLMMGSLLACSQNILVLTLKKSSSLKIAFCSRLRVLTFASYEVVLSYLLIAFQRVLLECLGLKTSLVWLMSDLRMLLWYYWLNSRKSLIDYPFSLIIPSLLIK